MQFWPPMFKEEEPQTTAAAEMTSEENKGDSSWEWSHVEAEEHDFSP